MQSTVSPGFASARKSFKLRVENEPEFSSDSIQEFRSLWYLKKACEKPVSTWVWRTTFLLKAIRPWTYQYLDFDILRGAMYSFLCAAAFLIILGVRSSSVSVTKFGLGVLGAGVGLWICSTY